MDKGPRDEIAGKRDRSHGAHLPVYVLRLLAKGSHDSLIAQPREVEGAYAFLDISGFTPLSETLSKHGREGTEILTDTISSYFRKALESVFVFGGDVVKFGGDALTILFERMPGENKEGPLLRACSSALSVADSVSDYEAKTPFGTFSLKLKTGISRGTVQFMVLGDPSARLEYVFSGDPIDQTAEAEHHASPGQTVVDPACAEELKDIADLSPLGAGFASLTALACPAERVSGEDLAVADPGLVKPFLFPAVFEHIRMGNEKMLSEHRPVVSCFVSFPTIDLGAGNNHLLLQHYFLKVTGLLRGLGGSFNRMDMGDKGSKFLCFFGAPESYADNEERAVAFALELKEFEKKEKWLSGQSVGITSGICYAGMVGSENRREYTVMGDTVNVSARLMSAAKGSVLVSNDVREKTRKKFSYGPYRKLRLKGKQAETSVSTPLRLSGRSEMEGSKPSALFVGREAELKKLLSLIERSPKPVYLNGPPGIGKSALAKEAAMSLPADKWKVTSLSAPISPPHPFYSAEKVFRAVTSSEGEGRGALDLLRDKFPGQADLLPLFSILINERMDPTPVISALSAEQKLETLAELFSKLLGVCSRKHLLILDDFDRTGKEEADLFSKLFERFDSKSVKFQLIGRRDTPPFGKMQLFSLTGLNKEGIEKYLLARFRAKAVPESLISFLLERSSGNPLYLNEIVSGLKEMKAIATNSEGFVVWNSDAASRVSKSIEEILMMRLDNLDYTRKNLLKVASCMGESFDAETLSKIYFPKMELSEISLILDQMQDIGIEREEGSKYRFSNKLLRNVAYDSILVSNRKALHGEIAREIEQTDNSDNSWEILAYHFSGAENHEKAFEYSLKAARNAFGISAFHEARRLYEICLKNGKSAGYKLGDMDLLDYSKSLVSTGEYDEAMSLLAKLRDSSCEATAVNARFLQLTILDQKGDYKKTVEEADSLITIAEKIKNGKIAVSTVRYEVSSLIRLGKYEDAITLLEKGYKTTLDFSLEDELPSLYILSGSIFYFKGDYPKSQGYYSTALEFSSQIAAFELMLRAYFGLSNCFLALGDNQLALENAEKALTVAKKIGSRMNVVGASTTIAISANALGHTETALSALINAGSFVDQVKYPYAAMSYYNALGGIYFFSGKPCLALRQFRTTSKVAFKLGNIQYMVNSAYNISDIQRELGEKKKAKSGFVRIIRNYAPSIDRSFLLKIASDLLDLVEEDLESHRIIKLLRKTAISLQSPLLFEDLISRHGAV